MKRISLSIVVSCILLIGLTGTSHAIPWYQPAGLNSGDMYHIVFVTANGINADNLFHDPYVVHVNDEADMNAELGQINFSPIISTFYLSAKDYLNITGPVYNTQGWLIANDETDLWDGELLAPIVFDQDGGNPWGSDDTGVWTGTLANGTKAPAGYEVGVPMVRLGVRDAVNGSWLDSNVSVNPASFSLPLYAMSDPIQVQAVPLPAAIYLLGAGFIGIVGLRKKIQK